MIPFIRAGDTVTIVPAAEGRLGDIVLLFQRDRWVLHRVVAKAAGQIITKGDALGQLDEPVTVQDICGRAVSLERGGKVRSLDSLASRLLGLAFSLTVSRVPNLISLLAAAKRLAREGLGMVRHG
jgi:hypothetical protein